MTKQGKLGFHYDNLENGCNRMKIVVMNQQIYKKIYYSVLCVVNTEE